ncbi:MAG TPA: RES domain-containing protein [Candidatus Elarobacter sp.]|nr:RES domain-containing protein [Candidatus Elarobacter sp.]
MSRGADPLKLPAWERLRAAERGRYDDPLDVFRALYASTSKSGALVETLADLRPRFDRMHELQAIGGERLGFEPFRDAIGRAAASMRERLQGRYLATIRVVDRGPLFVDLAAGASRGRLEYRARTTRLKTGQLTGRDRMLPRFAARDVFDEGYAGLIMPSAESSYAHTVAVFETGYRTGCFRARLEVISVVPALSSRTAVAAAIRALLGVAAISPLVVAELLEAAS